MSTALLCLWAKVLDCNKNEKASFIKAFVILCFPGWMQCDQLPQVPATRTLTTMELWDTMNLSFHKILVSDDFIVARRKRLQWKFFLDFREEQKAEQKNVMKKTKREKGKNRKQS